MERTQSGAAQQTWETNISIAQTAVQGADQITGPRVSLGICPRTDSRVTLEAGKTSAFSAFIGSVFAQQASRNTATPAPTTLQIPILNADSPSARCLCTSCARCLCTRLDTLLGELPEEMLEGQPAEEPLSKLAILQILQLLELQPLPMEEFFFQKSFASCLSKLASYRTNHEHSPLIQGFVEKGLKGALAANKPRFLKWMAVVTIQHLTVANPINEEPSLIWLVVQDLVKIGSNNDDPCYGIAAINLLNLLKRHNQSPTMLQTWLLDNLKAMLNDPPFQPLKTALIVNLMQLHLANEDPIIESPSQRRYKDIVHLFFKKVSKTDVQLAEAVLVGMGKELDRETYLTELLTFIRSQVAIGLIGTGQKSQKAILQNACRLLLSQTKSLSLDFSTTSSSEDFFQAFLIAVTEATLTLLHASFKKDVVTFREENKTEITALVTLLQKVISSNYELLQHFSPERISTAEALLTSVIEALRKQGMPPSLKLAESLLERAFSANIISDAVYEAILSNLIEDWSHHGASSTIEALQIKVLCLYSFLGKSTSEC